MTQDLAARLKRAGRRCTVLVCHEQTRRVAPRYDLTHDRVSSATSSRSDTHAGGRHLAVLRCRCAYSVVEVRWVNHNTAAMVANWSWCITVLPQQLRSIAVSE